jgi:hypothetical protein
MKNSARLYARIPALTAARRKVKYAKNVLKRDRGTELLGIADDSHDDAGFPAFE